MAMKSGVDMQSAGLVHGVQGMQLHTQLRGPGVVGGPRAVGGVPHGQGGAAPSAPSNPAPEGSTPQQSNMANTKEKTPMCLINELARFNKIHHTYTLTDEQGPAHKKTFYVKLQLGDEDYSADGPSIKKAQHLAAGNALVQTKYKHPVARPPRAHTAVNMGRPHGSMTPTVELNALAMKRGEAAVYRPIEMPRQDYGAGANMDYRGMYNQRYHYPRFPRVCYVSLKVGQREFIGEGNSRQVARHNAAVKALKVISALPLPEGVILADPEEPQVTGDVESQDAIKSDISLVHEIALQHNLSVNFEVIRESGPPHMRTFVTRCTVGTHMTEGEGNGKKVSKTRAATKMLEEVKDLAPGPSSAIRLRKPLVVKKKSKNIIKKASVDYGQGINPISRLIQVQQAKKERDPVYTLITERGMPRRREFVIQVQVGDHVCTGVGPNKKLAKRNAAEVMLQLLGYSQAAPQPNKPAMKTGETMLPGDKKVTFLDQDGNPSCQLVPGVLLMPNGRGGPGMGAVYGMNGQPGLNRAPGSPRQPGMMISPQTMATIARELLDTGKSNTAEAIKRGGVPPGPITPLVRPKQQLEYLASVLAFQIQFTDFPKSPAKKDFVSMVSLSANPPQVSHGAGLTVEESHDMAALSALKSLAELDKEMLSGGDGYVPQ